MSKIKVRQLFLFMSPFLTQTFLNLSQTSPVLVKFDWHGLCEPSCPRVYKRSFTNELGPRHCMRNNWSSLYGPFHPSLETGLNQGPRCQYKLYSQLVLIVKGRAVSPALCCAGTCSERGCCPYSKRAASKQTNLSTKNPKYNQSCLQNKKVLPRSNLLPRFHQSLYVDLFIYFSIDSKSVHEL